MSIDLSVLDLEQIPGSSGGTGREELTDTDKKMVCLLLAIGEPTDTAANKLGLHKSLVENYVQSTEGIDRVIRMQTALFPDPAARIKRNAHLAIDASLRLLLRSKSDPVVAKVAADILDRSMGKATQVIENRNLNVSVTDMKSADRALAAQMERLARLEETQRKVLAARSR